MKKLFFLVLFFSFNILTFSANVYFLNGGSGYIYTNGQTFYTTVPVGYWIWADPTRYTYDHCGANFQDPNGSWSGWSDLSGGQGIHNCSQAGTWHVQGRVHVVADVYGGQDYWMYTSFTLYFYVVAPPPPLTVSISGPSVAQCQTSTWTANASGGSTPYSYQWYQMWDCGGAGPQSSQTSDIQPYRPCNVWYAVGTNSPTLQYYWCSGNGYLRVDVTDAHNNIASAQYYVMGSGGGLSLQGSMPDYLGADMKVAPKEYGLDQNYPNPFNPTTQISYALKENGFVTIKVYDLLGKVVATLVNENKPAGFYTVNFDASRLSSGIYFYIIKTNNFFDRKKMIVLK
jgi:Secretion system C-terminal sorting domain